MLRRLFPPLTLGFLGLVLVLTRSDAADPPAGNQTEAQVKELGNKQEFLSRQWKEFSKNLLLIAQKLQKSTRPEDQEKAKTLFKVLELAEKEGVENKFNLLVRTLNTKGDAAFNDFNTATAKNEELIKVLDQILSMLLNDDDLARIQAERKTLEAYLKELKAILGDQKIARAITETNKADKDQLSKEQKDLANRTDNLAKAMNGQKGDPKKGSDSEPKDDKANSKGEGENKNAAKGDDKQDTGDPKATEKPNEPKEPMSGEGKPKSGEGSGSEGKPKSGPPSDGEPKPKSGDPKSPAESKNKGDQKGDQKESNAKGSEGANKPNDAKQGDAQQQASSKSGGPPKPGGQPGQSNPSQQPSPPPAPGAENVKKAVPDQENAAEQIEQKKNNNASKKQDDAITKLEEARKELEKKLKQLREEELERLLANLEARISRMLAMQKDVKTNTVELNKIAAKAPDLKLRERIDVQRSQQQSEREGEIVAEADKTLQILQAEGTVVAFPGVLEEVRKDMIRIKERLYVGIVNEDTIAIEQDVIDALTEMLEALKKAQQDLKSGGGGGSGGPPPDQKLLDELAELKMIRSLQDNVNKRTKRYGEKYPGEQADDPIIRADLRDLSGKQEKIEQMVKDMKEGRNK